MVDLWTEEVEEGIGEEVLALAGPLRAAQEINVAMPPPSALRDKLISNKRTMLCLPQGLAAGQRSCPHIENHFLFPAVYPPQGIENDTPETSLEYISMDISEYISICLL